MSYVVVVRSEVALLGRGKRDAGREESEEMESDCNAREGESIQGGLFTCKWRCTTSRVGRRLMVVYHSGMAVPAIELDL